MMLILLYALVAALYFGLSVWGWRNALAQGAPSDSEAGLPGGSMMLPMPVSATAPATVPVWERVLLLLVLLAHGALIHGALLSPEGLRLGFAIALSATLWLAVAVIWVESLYFGLAHMRLLVLPLAGLCSLLPMWFPGSTALLGPVGEGSPTQLDGKLVAHLIVALAAYGLLTLAALHALLMTALDRWLHQENSPDFIANASSWDKVENAVLGRLPPLLTMERLLFRLVAAGFVLLTLTVLTGIVFSEALFGKPLQFNHKTVFTLISWLIFGALLVGRHFYGWRGRVALRWTLSGFVVMLLAYAGSRFVLEVVLHRV